MEVWSAVVVAFIGTVGSIWGAWLTYKAARTESKADAQINHFTALHDEIDRLREDLKDRDEIARKGFQEIVELRQGVRSANDRIYDLEHQLEAWVTAAEVLYRQLKEDAKVDPLIGLPANKKEIQ